MANGDNNNNYLLNSIYLYLVNNFYFQSNFKFKIIIRGK